jgi:hypothetical protein
MGCYTQWRLDVFEQDHTGIRRQTATIEVEGNGFRPYRG